MKRFIAVMIVLATLAVLVGCAEVEEHNNGYYEGHAEILGFTVLNHAGKTYMYDYYVVYDNETNVIYYLSYTSSGIALCPRYDSCGEVMIYEGE